MLVLAPGERLHREFLFLRSLDPEAERWTGVRAGIGDSLRTALGFGKSRGSGSHERHLARRSRIIPCFITSPPRSRRPQPRSPESELYGKLQARIPGLSVKNHQGQITGMRHVKSAEELALMEKAIANTLAAHRVTARSIRPGARRTGSPG